jgi:hypothetical protein
MIEMMNLRIEKAAEAALAEENSEAGSVVEPPTAYIPACGTLCDVFWWARRSPEREKSSD